MTSGSGTRTLALEREGFSVATTPLREVDVTAQSSAFLVRRPNPARTPSPSAPQSPLPREVLILPRGDLTLTQVQQQQQAAAHGSPCLGGRANCGARSQLGRLKSSFHRWLRGLGREPKEEEVGEWHTRGAERLLLPRGFLIQSRH